MEKINSEFLRKLPIGFNEELKCASPKHCESVRSLAYRVPKMWPEHKDKKYTCKVNYVKSTVHIKVTEREKVVMNEEKEE